MARLTTDFRALLQEGVDLFNRRAFFEAHEAWEAIWRTNPGEPAYFLHGLIQIAAGFVKLQRGEPKGAAALLAKGARKLERFSPGSLALRADQPGIHLAVQFVPRLARNEMQRKPLRRSSAQPFSRLDPGWMRRAIVIAEPGDLVGIELDAAGGRAQLVPLGIGAKIPKQDVFVGSRRYLDPALFPECVKLGDQVALRALAESVVEVTQPRRLVAALGEGVFAT